MYSLEENQSEKMTSINDQVERLNSLDRDNPFHEAAFQAINWNANACDIIEKTSRQSESNVTLDEAESAIENIRVTNDLIFHILVK